MPVDNPESNETPRRRVLLCELAPGGQTLAAKILENRGHRVAVTIASEAAIDLLRSESFDAVLLDLELAPKEVQGIVAVVEGVRRTQGARLPIMGIAAYRSQGIETPADMDVLLSRPLDGRWLAAALDAACSTPARTSPSGVEISCDPAAAISRLGGDEALYREVVERFLGGAPEWIAKIDGAVASADCERLHRAAHSLKGLAAICGAVAVARVAGHLEQLGRDKEAATAHDLGQLKTAFAETQIDLAGYVDLSAT